MDSKFKGKIISAIRKLSYSFPERTLAKNKRKRGPATYECEHCNAYIYEGSKPVDLFLGQAGNTPYKAGKIKMDHIDPVVPVEGFQKGEWDWHEFILRMFCPLSGWQAICEDCHRQKSDEENKIRRKTKQSKDINKEIL